jgi:hypothetical protein
MTTAAIATRPAYRQLHFDDYVLPILLWMFNPALDSMRALQRVAGVEEVRRKLKIKGFSLGSFSESCRRARI